METAKIYLDLSEDILAWMADNGLSIEDVLEKEGIDAEVVEGVIPVDGQSGGRTKNVVPIILASAGGASAILFAVSHCLKTWLNRPIYESWEELEEIRDENGKIMVDKDGNPRMKTVRKHVLVEPGKTDKKEKIDLKAGLTGIVLGMNTEEKQIQNGK
jgi:hypothetical protein